MMHVRLDKSSVNYFEMNDSMDNSLWFYLRELDRGRTDNSFMHLLFMIRENESSHVVSSGKASISIYKIDIIHSSRVDFNNLWRYGFISGKKKSLIWEEGRMYMHLFFQAVNYSRFITLLVSSFMTFLHYTFFPGGLGSINLFCPERERERLFEGLDIIFMLESTRWQLTPSILLTSIELEERHKSYVKDGC